MIWVPLDGASFRQILVGQNIRALGIYPITRVPEEPGVESMGKGAAEARPSLALCLSAG